MKQITVANFMIISNVMLRLPVDNTSGTLQIQDRSPQLRPFASECFCYWLRNATFLDCGDRSWFCNAPQVRSQQPYFREGRPSRPVLGPILLFFPSVAFLFIPSPFLYSPFPFCQEVAAKFI